MGSLCLLQDTDLDNIFPGEALNTKVLFQIKVDLTLIICVIYMVLFMLIMVKSSSYDHPHAPVYSYSYSYSFIFICDQHYKRPHYHDHHGRHTYGFDYAHHG